MSTTKEDIKESVKRMATTLREIRTLTINTLATRPTTHGEDWQHLSKALAKIREMCPVPVTFERARAAAALSPEAELAETVKRQQEMEG